MASAKRSSAEMDRLRLQQATLFLRSVRQRGLPYHHPQQQSHMISFSNDQIPFSPSMQPQPEKKELVKNQLQELERELLLDEDEDADLSVSGVTNSEWSETMESLISPSPPATTTTTSSSSSPSSSCSQTSVATTKQLLQDSAIAASAIAEGNMETAALILANCQCETDEKFSGHMIQALLSRINPLKEDPSLPVAELCSREHMDSTHLLYEVSPCFKLGILAANLAILDAVRDLPKIHILDFNFGNGSHYLPLLNSLAEHRSCHLRCVKITAFADPQNPYSMNTINAEGLPLLGDRIARLAERKGLSVSFNVAALRASELTRAAISCVTDEALAVNLAFALSKVADESVTPANPRDELLRAVRRLRPRIVTLVEEEINCNTTPLAVRFAEASGHYGAVAESLEVAAGERGRVEECIGRRAANAVGQEGWRRVERCEMFGKWRARMGMAGLQAGGLGRFVVESARRHVRSCNAAGWTVEEEGSAVKVLWRGRVMTVTSAWR